MGDEDGIDQVKEEDDGSMALGIDWTYIYMGDEDGIDQVKKEGVKLGRCRTHVDIGESHLVRHAQGFAGLVLRIGDGRFDSLGLKTIKGGFAALGIKTRCGRFGGLGFETIGSGFERPTVAALSRSTAGMTQLAPTITVGGGWVLDPDPAVGGTIPHAGPVSCGGLSPGCDSGPPPPQALALGPLHGGGRQGWPALPGRPPAPMVATVGAATGRRRTAGSRMAPLYKKIPKHSRSSKSRFTKTVKVGARFTILAELLKGCSNKLSSLELGKFTHHRHSLHKDQVRFYFSSSSSVVFSSSFVVTKTSSCTHACCRPANSVTAAPCTSRLTLPPSATHPPWLAPP